MKYILSLFLLFSILNGNIYGQQKRKLIVSDDGHTFQYDDGTPFFWLADTAWELFHRLDRMETDFYLETRKGQGYNVIQAVILSELKGLEEPNRFGELPLANKDPNKPNEAYFKNIDYVLKKAASLDMYIALLPTWGRYWSEEKIFNKENAFIYGKFLGERYKDQNNIIWILGGDRIPKNEEEYEIINQMAKGLKEGDGGSHLISFHPSGNNTSISLFPDESWIDFHMAQSGHAHKDMPNFLYPLNNNFVKPAKPFIDGEPRYEDLPVRFWEMKLDKKYINNPYPVAESDTPHGYFDDFDIRRAAYWSVFSGAAGFTYGNGSIWCFWNKGRSAPIAIRHSWRKAMESPGGNQMQFLKKLINIYGIDQLLPDRSVIVDNWSACSNYQTALITKNKKAILLYIPLGNPVKVSQKKLAAGSFSYKWFNPRIGKFSKPIKLDNNSIVMNFNPPSQGKGNDWVLVVESK